MKLMRTIKYAHKTLLTVGAAPGFPVRTGLPHHHSLTSKHHHILGLSKNTAASPQAQLQRICWSTNWYSNLASWSPPGKLSRKKGRKRVFFLLQAGNLFLLHYFNDFKPSSTVKFAELYLMACLVFLIIHWCFIRAAWTEVAGFRGGN